MESNGWELFAHPLLLDQLDRLASAVERDKAKKPKEYRSSANFKLLAALNELLFVVIPADPTRPEFRQGTTLSGAYKHWFRAKFGAQRFRLFFRFDTRARVIIYAWVNDEHSKRTYGSRTDAYAVFKNMLESGQPPDAWAELLKASRTSAAVERFSKRRRGT
ncbi:MAG: hypothetical protein RL653_2197 [Pseudomonadota bacterium]